MLSCSALIYLLGATWLGVWLNQNVEPTSILAVLNKGVFPFIPGDLVKCGLAAVLLPTIWRRVGRERPPADS
jgi:biotin transport system substrate-specific component